MKNEKEYALYDDDDFIAIGTLEELAKKRNIKKESLEWHLYPSVKEMNRNKRTGIFLVDLGSMERHEKTD